MRLTIAKTRYNKRLQLVRFALVARDEDTNLLGVVTPLVCSPQAFDDLQRLLCPTEGHHVAITGLEVIDGAAD